MKKNLNEIYSHPGKPLNKELFKALIEEAEKGPFFTIEQSKQSFQKWREKKYKMK